jgi:hypothetical protein
MQELIARLCGCHFSELQNHYSHAYDRRDEKGMVIGLPDSEQDPMRIHLAELQYLVREVDVERYNELFNNDELHAQLAEKDKQHLVIRGCPIFSVSRCRWMISCRIICETHTNSPAVPPLPMQQIFNPMDIRDITHLRT